MAPLQRPELDRPAELRGGADTWDQPQGSVVLASEWFAPPGPATSTGTLASTDAPDTTAAAGQALATGTLASTDALDTTAAAGRALATGTLASTDAPDTTAAAGQVFEAPAAATGALASTDAPDVAAFLGGDAPVEAQRRRGAILRRIVDAQARPNGTSSSTRAGQVRAFAPPELPAESELAVPASGVPRGGRSHTRGGAAAISAGAAALPFQCRHHSRVGGGFYGAKRGGAMRSANGENQIVQSFDAGAGGRCACFQPFDNHSGSA